MYYEDEQASLFAPDTPSTKTSQEPSVATEARTGGRSSRNSSGSQTRTLPPYLFLQKENGSSGEATWVADPTVCGALPIASTTVSFMASRSDADECAFYVTIPGGQPGEYCLTLNIGERPRQPIQSKLSQILEPNPDERYNLSPKACAGILGRAERRGKKLPEALETALRNQMAEAESE